MLVGGLLLLVTAVRLPSALDKSDGGSSADEGASGELCVGQACRANNDPRPTRGYESPSIVVDSDDPMHQLVIDVNLVGARCSWHTTFDGGKTWEDGIFELPQDYRRCQLDSSGLLPIGNVLLGSGDRAYAVMTSVNVAGSAAPDASGERVRADRGESVLMATTEDGGKTWGPAREVVPGAGTDRAYVRPAISVVTTEGSPDRILLTMWGCGDGRCTQGFFAQSLDGGQTFSEPLLITPDPGGNSPSAATMAADGTIYLTYLRRYQGAPTDIMLSRSSDDGASFQDVKIDAQNTVGQNYDSAKIAVDPVRGWLYLAYSDNRDGLPKVFVRRSEDKGATWERDVRLQKSAGGRSYGPAMSVAADGRIDVVFYKRIRNLTDEVHATYSTDGGKTFTPDEKVNGATIDRRIGYAGEVGNHYIPALSAVPGSVTYAWSDTRDGTVVTNTQETFIRRFTRPAVTAGPG